MKKPSPMSDAYVKQWSIVSKFASVVSLLPVPVILILYATEKIPFARFHGHVPTMLLLIVISIMFDMKRGSLIENQKIYKAIKDLKKDKA